MACVDQMLALTAADGAEGAPEGSAATRFSPDLPGVVSSTDSWPIRTAIVRARSALINQRLDEASKQIAKLNRLLNTCDRSQFPLYSQTLRILRAFRLVVEDDLGGARSVLATLPPAARNTMAATILQYLDWRCSETEVYSSDTVDHLAPPVGGQVIDRIYGLCMSAALAFDRLHLTVSASLATEALELARRRDGNHSALTSLPATMLAQVAYEQGRLEEAESLLRPRMPVIRASGIPECVVRATTLLARLSLHRGRHASALAALRDAVALGRARGWSRLQSVASSEYARALQLIRCRDERICEPSALAHEGPADSRDGHRGCPSGEDATHSQTLSGVSLEIRRVITRPRIVTVHSNASPRFSTIESALQHACDVAADGCVEESYDLVIECLRTGAAHGLRMVFVDAAPEILPLLAGLHRTIPAHHPPLADLRPYIVTLLKSPTREETEEPVLSTYRSLSRREGAVLQMIARGMSNKCIARSLGITPETVKTHAKSIFSKLETRTRAQAVARAEAIGLL